MFKRVTDLEICHLDRCGEVQETVYHYFMECTLYDKQHLQLIAEVTVLYELHWLPIYKRIAFKLLLLVYQSVNQLAPTYLCELLKPYEEVQMRDDLRSTTQHLLHIPRSG